MNGQINISRFIAKLDSCFDRNDLKAAKECIEYWEKEARETGDDRALLTVLNEAVGFYRRTQKRGRALAAMEESLALVDKLGLPDKLSGATIYINAATTLSFFGKEEEGLQLYDKAARCYEIERHTETYEYAALLNNKAGTLNALKRYDEAERDWVQAIEILKEIGGHAGEIAISLVMLAHLTFIGIPPPMKKWRKYWTKRGNISIRTIRRKTETTHTFYENARLPLIISKGTTRRKPCEKSQKKSITNDNKELYYGKQIRIK